MLSNSPPSKVVITLHHTIPSFNDSETKACEKIVGKGENAVNQHFLLFPHVFYKIKDRDYHVSNTKIVVCNCFQFGQSQNFVFGKDMNEQKAFSDSKLTLSKMTNFRLFQMERVCRQQCRTWQKWQKVFLTGRKHCGKRINCSLRAVYPFPTVFSKDLHCRHVKTRACLGKG